jgi:2-methylisocitrate lyase-like PEP mutase family enzyme
VGEAKIDAGLRELGESFRALHEGEAFVIPNPWDPGSAKAMAALGFRALATTSSGFAFSRGLPDGGPSLEQVLDHVAALATATPLPLSVDLENGHGAAPEDAARAISGAAGAGAVGGSIEDYDPEDGIYELAEAAERVAAASEAARALGFPFTLTARAENQIRGNPDLDDTIARLRAYEEAGADVLYAPGLASAEAVKEVCEAVSKPVNVHSRPEISMEEMVAAGAQRVSVGGSLAWVAYEAMGRAAEAIRDRGDFSALGVQPPIGEWLGG